MLDRYWENIKLARQGRKRYITTEGMNFFLPVLSEDLQK